MLGNVGSTRLDVTSELVCSGARAVRNSRCLSPDDALQLYDASLGQWRSANELVDQSLIFVIDPALTQKPDLDGIDEHAVADIEAGAGLLGSLQIGP